MNVSRETPAPPPNALAAEPVFWIAQQLAAVLQSIELECATLPPANKDLHHAWQILRAAQSDVHDAALDIERYCAHRAGLCPTGVAA